MAYVQQTCEGYNKKTMVGNWYEERLYPSQSFRDNTTKNPRPKDEAINTYSGTGFQRSLPRLERRNKWQTKERIILNDNVPNAPTVMKAEYPHYQMQSSTNSMKKPFDKNTPNVYSSSQHPSSEVKPSQINYHIIDRTSGGELDTKRGVSMYGSDFKSTLPQHPPVQKFTNYISQYKGRVAQGNNTIRDRTTSDFMQTRQSAGNYSQVKQEETVKPITTMFCENKKEFGDEKEMTHVQRSWVPQRDKALSYTTGMTGQHFKKGSVPRNDIQTSLNMNTGTQGMHPMAIEDNYFRHKRDISLVKNNTFCNRP